MTDVAEIKAAVDTLASSAKTFHGSHSKDLAEQGERLARLETAFRRTASGAELKVAGDSPELKAAFHEYARSGDPGELKALSVNYDPQGGYLVNPEMSSRIVTRIFETSPLRTVATVMETTKDAVEFIRDTDEVDANWADETTARSETDTADLGKIRIPVHDLHAQPRATQKQLDDSDISIEEWLSGKAADKFRRKENAAFVTGNGIAKPRGFITYPTSSSDDDTRAWGTLQYVASGSTSGFPIYEDNGDTKYHQEAVAVSVTTLENSELSMGTQGSHHGPFDV
jgi:HK97 family phage major capsid protein